MTQPSPAQPESPAGESAPAVPATLHQQQQQQQQPQQQQQSTAPPMPLPLQQNGSKPRLPLAQQGEPQGVVGPPMHLFRAQAIPNCKHDCAPKAAQRMLPCAALHASLVRGPARTHASAAAPPPLAAAMPHRPAKADHPVPAGSDGLPGGVPGAEGVLLGGSPETGLIAVSSSASLTSSAAAAQAAAEGNKTLYLGNLHPFVTEQTLQEVFAGLGGITELKVWGWMGGWVGGGVGRSRCCG